jgi:oligopeptide transport system ATP-binding protein
MTALLDATDVTVGFGRLTAVDGVSLALAKGETLGLVGESGSGKTSLAKALIGLVKRRSGQILIDGRSIDALDRAGRLWLRRCAQITLQDAAAALSPRFTVRRLIEEPLRIHGLRQPERLTEMVEALGLGDGLLDRYPHELSGGQAKRVGLARALILEPKLLIADEPTAGLDVSVQGEILTLLAGLRDRLGLALLLITHNLAVARRVTDRLAVMYVGGIVEIGPTDALFDRPAHPYTAALIAAMPTIDPARTHPRTPPPGEIPSPFDPPPGCRFHPRCPRAQAICRTVPPALLPVSPDQAAACHFPIGAPARPPGG